MSIVRPISGTLPQPNLPPVSLPTGTFVTINGVSFQTLSVSSTPSYSMIDERGGEYQMEVRAGDITATDLANSDFRNRSELICQSNQVYGNDHWISFDRMITEFPSGVPECIFAQIHAPNAGHGPIIPFRINEGGNEALQVKWKLAGHSTNYLKPGGGGQITAIDAWVGSPPVLGEWVHWLAHIKQDDTAGIAKIWRNGVNIIDYTGPLGFTEEQKVSRLQVGIYSGLIPGAVDGDPATARQVRFRNVFTGSSVLT